MKLFLCFLALCSTMFAKEELHLQIMGAFPKSYLAKIASGEDYEDEALYKNVDTEKKYTDGVLAIIEDLEEKGVSYAELRTPLKDYGSGKEHFLKSVLKAMRESDRKTGLDTRLILSIRRDASKREAEEMVKLALKYAPDVVGLELAAGRGSTVYEPLINAKAQGIPLTLCIDEDLDNQLNELLILNPDRVSDTNHLSGEARLWILQNRIPVELCLTIEDAEDYPALTWLEKGHPVSLSSNAQEYSLAADALGVSCEELEAKLTFNRFGK